MTSNRSPSEASRPRSEVLQGFGVEPSTVLERLLGGRGTVYRAGDIVLKKLDTTLEELEWLVNTFGSSKVNSEGEDEQESLGISLSVPIFGRAEDGSKSLVIAGWTAWNWVDGVSSASLGPLLGDVEGTKGRGDGDLPSGYQEYDSQLTYKWDYIIMAGEKFSALTRQYNITKPEFLEARKDPWGLADRVAWNEVSLDKEMVTEVHVDGKTYVMPVGPRWRTEARYLGETLDILHGLDDINGSIHESFQIIHGDLTGNVLFSLPSLIPTGIIDISPYFRPPSFSTAIVVVDALACERAPKKWAMKYLKTRQDVKMFAHALIFRIVSDYLLGIAGVGAEDDYTSPVEVLRRVVEE